MKFDLKSLPGGGVRIDTGQKPQALLLHGYGGTHRDLLPLALSLAQAGHSVWLPDLPGHGDAPGELTSEALTEAMERWNASIGRVPGTPGWLLLGHSLGARVAWAMARPGDGLVSVSPPLSAGFSSELRKELLSVLRPRWVRESRPMMGLVEALDTLPEAPEFQIEHLLLVAGRDLSSVEEAAALLKDSPGCQIERIPHTDHTSILLHPATSERILGWIGN